MRAGSVLAGRYEIVRSMAKGGMAEILEARDQGRQRVAIKLLRDGLSKDPEVITRFEREAKVASGLKSNHAVRIFDFGTAEGGRPFMVMEYLFGNDLSKEIEKRAPFSIEDAATYLAQTCHAMIEAHKAGVIHRDLKPTNLFLAREAGKRVIKVLDFGIAKVTSGGDPDLTLTNSLFGSPLYMAPECFKSAKLADPRSDIWALGVIFYEMLTGVPPFQAENAVGVGLHVAHEKHTPPSHRRPELPRSIDVVVGRALKKDPAARYQTMGEFLAAFEVFLPRGRNDTMTMMRPITAAAVSDDDPRTMRKLADVTEMGMINPSQPDPLEASTRVVPADPDPTETPTRVVPADDDSDDEGPTNIRSPEKSAALLAKHGVRPPAPSAPVAAAIAAVVGAPPVSPPMVEMSPPMSAPPMSAPPISAPPMSAPRLNPPAIAAAFAPQSNRASSGTFDELSTSDFIIEPDATSSERSGAHSRPSNVGETGRVAGPVSVDTPLAEPAAAPRRKMPPTVWAIPAVALIFGLGGWMLARSSEGPAPPAGAAASEPTANATATVAPTTEHVATSEKPAAPPSTAATALATSAEASATETAVAESASASSDAAPPTTTEPETTESSNAAVGPAVTGGKRFGKPAGSSSAGKKKFTPTKI